jgi:hypothetical protein
LSVTALRPSPKMQFTDASGNLLSGGKLYTYTAGTTTNLATYTDSTGTSANTNPVILDSRGEASIWFQPLNYKLVLKDSSDNTIWTQDNYSGSPYPITDEWITYVHTWTFIDATHVSTTGDQTAIYTVNKAVRAVTTAGTYYGTITASAYGSVTTLTVDFESGAFDSGVAASSTVSIGVQSSESPALTYAAAASTSATAAATSATAAASSATNAANSATAAAASAATINLPSITGNASNMLRANAGETALEYRTPTQVRSDIAAAALAGNTFTGAQILSDQQVSRAMLIDCGYTYLDKGNSSTTTQDLAYTGGSHQKITATGNFTITTSAWPPTGNLGVILLEATNFGAYTVTWPTINWVKPDGTTTTSVSTWLAAVTGRTAFQTSGTDFIRLISRDAGTTIYGGFAL